MRFSTSFGVAAIAALLASGSAAATAQTGMKNGSADVNTTKARCSPGDPNVMVDAKTKTYVLDTAANHAAAGATTKTGGATSDTAPSDNNNAAAGGPAANPGAVSGANGAMTGKGGAAMGMKSMCKSEAESMGAKMMPASNTPQKM